AASSPPRRPSRDSSRASAGSSCAVVSSSGTSAGSRAWRRSQPSAMPSLMSHLTTLALRIMRNRERLFGSAVRMRAAIAADRERGPALPSRGMRRRVAVDERIVAGARVFRVRPRDGGKDVAVVYFHGGAFVYDALKYHWHMVERLVRASGATVHVP